MNKAIIGKKLGMSQVFLADGTMVPVTVISAGPCTVVQKKTIERDGYQAIQLGFQEVKESKLNKPQLGHLKKANAGNLKVLKEFKFDDCDKYNVGDTIECDVFEQGDYVDVTGIQKVTVTQASSKDGIKVD